jgi:tetratricopeptide (TPR) repeat protein
MKIKAVYLYIILFVVIVVGLVLIDTSPDTNSGTTVAPMASSQMPNDAIHKGEMPNDDIHKALKGNNGPSKGDVLPQYYEHLDSLAKAWKINQADTLLGLEYAHYLAAGHQTGKAISVYDEMIRRNPNSLSLREEAAYVAFKGSDYDLSEKYVKQILAKDKGNLNAKFNYGLIQLFKKDTLNARNVWNEIVRNHPNSNEAKRAKGALSNLK